MVTGTRERIGNEVVRCFQQRQQLLLHLLRSQRTNEALANMSRFVQHIGLRHAVHTEIQSDPSIAIHADARTSGNGGDISIDVPVVALDSGAIQANTLAPLASGGTVTINAQALVPSYQSFILGGSALAFNANATGLNVVQAAAPDGVNGALSVTVPTLDLGNALLGLTGRPSAPVMLGRDLCGSTRGSSLAVAGRGGVAPTAYDPLWIEAHVDSSMAAENGERSAWRDAACR